MEGKQLSLFPDFEYQRDKNYHKKAKLGRYEKIQYELNNNDNDPYKKFIEIEEQPSCKSDYKFVDLFCGAGGMTQGLVQAGFEPIVSVEENSIASATHRINFPKCHHFCGDIKEFYSTEWLRKIGSPEIHLVVGGPPCQGFSVAGKRNPDDPRNNLFREFVRVVSEIRPWYIVMENVPGIITMKKGAIKDEICQAFVDIGYSNISVAILESAAYGVPQIRPRTFFIANKFGKINPYPKPQLLPKKEV